MPEDADGQSQSAPLKGPAPSPAEVAIAPALPQPTLAAYFGEPAPKFADWMKAVRAVGSFTATDSEEVLRDLSVRDPDLRKTLALARAGNAPAFLRRWVANATRYLLADRLRDVLIDPHSAPHEQVGRIAQGLAPALRSKDRTARAAAESLLQLSIKLVTEARQDFNAAEMLALLFVPLRESDADARLAAADLRERLKEAGVALLRDLSLVQAAALNRILGAERARSEAQDRANTLDTALTIERDRVRELREKLATAEAHAEALKADVARLNQAVADHRQIGAHGTAELLARMRALLAGRIDPLLADAADALEIEPPILEVVRDRIESGRGVIKGELRWLDESSD